MKTIYKYEISTFQTPILIPRGGKVLKADVQDDLLFVWVLVDTDVAKVKRHFRVFGTGHEITCMPDSELQFIDTVFMDNGLVWHVFEQVNTL